MTPLPTPADQVPPRLLALESGFDHLPAKPRTSHLVLLTERDLETLRRRLSHLRARIAETGALPAVDDWKPDDWEPGGGHRLALLGASPDELADCIDLALRKLEPGPRGAFQAKGAVFYNGGTAPETGRRTVFLFPGQGSQTEGMLDELCAFFPDVRAWIEDLDRELADLDVIAPSVLAFQPSGELTEDERSALAIARTSLRGGAQLGIVANLALYELLTDVGVRPDLMVGHSNGENAAIYASGILGIDRATLLATCRQMTRTALSMPPPPVPEKVAAVSAVDRETIEAVVGRYPGLYLSMINCPGQHVIAGTEAAVLAGTADLAAAGALISPMLFRRAYHTPLFREWSEHLHAVSAGTTAVEPKVPLYSCWSAGRFPADTLGIRHHASAQLWQRIDFQATVERLYADGGRRFIEVGPGNALTGFVNDSLRGRDQLALPVSRAGASPLLDLERALARLYVDGVDLDFTSKSWQRLAAAGFAIRLAPEPTPRLASKPPGAGAVEHQPRQAVEAEIARRHFALMNEFLATQERVLGWVLETTTATTAASTTAAESSWPLLGRVTRPAASHGRTAAIEGRRRFTVARDPILGQHSLGPHLDGRSPGAHPLAVLPFTYSMEVAAEAALELFGGGVVRRMSELTGTRWLALDRGSLDLDVRAEIQAGGSQVARVQLSEVDGTVRHLAFEAEVEVGSGFIDAAIGSALDATPPAQSATWTPAGFYQDFAFHGPAFQAIRSVEGVDASRIVATLEIPARPATGGESARGFHLDPGLLDCAGQLVGLWLLENGKRNFGIFPFQVLRFEHLAPVPGPGATLRAVAEVRWLAAGVTEAGIDFFDAAGPIYRFRGFRQRYLPLPASLVGALMGTSAPDANRRPRRFVSRHGSSATFERVVDDLPESLLKESWGIWRRALAHHLLTPEELDVWYELESQDVPWLLGRAAAKEAVRTWAAAEGRLLESVDLEVTGPGSGTVEVNGSGTPLFVDVEQVDGATVARFRDPVPAVAMTPRGEPRQGLEQQPASSPPTLNP